MELVFAVITDIGINHYTMEVSPSQTVLEMKQRIQQLTGVPVFRQTIGYNGLILDDGFNLCHYEIVQGSTIILDIRTYQPATIQPPINQEQPARFYHDRYECPPISRFCPNPPPASPASAVSPQNPPPRPAFRMILRECRPMRRPSSFSPFFRSLVPLLFPSYTNFINQRNRQQTPEADGGVDETIMEELRRIIRSGKRNLEDMAGPSGVAAGGGDEEEGAEGGPSPRRQRVAEGGPSAGSFYDWMRLRDVEGWRRTAGTMVVVVEYREDRCMVEVRPDEAGSVLRDRIEHMGFRGLPRDGYYFVHRHRVFDEIQTFAWNRVGEGDSIHLFPGFHF